MTPLGDEMVRKMKSDEALGIGLSLAAALGFCVIVRAHSWFIADDYSGFWFATNESFGEFITQPIDVHFVPFHRLATWLIYTVFPMSFDAGLLVMCAFHLAGTWLLYRTLNLLDESPINGPLTVLCATNYYAAALLTWWTVGIARFPCILLSLATIYQYLVFRRDGRRTRVVAMLAYLVVAAAFFTKALLVPGVLGALELALLPNTPRRKLARNLVVVSFTGLIAIAYYQMGLAFDATEATLAPVDWGQQRAALELVLAKTSQSFFGLVPSHPLSIANRLIIALWVALCVISVVRDRFAAVLWLLGFGVLVANFAVITLSPRAMFGVVNVVQEDRYYFEAGYPIAIFLALIAKRVNLGGWLKDGRGGRLAVVALWIAVIGLAIGGQVRLIDQLRSPRYAVHRVAREFGLNLKRGIADLRRDDGGTLQFASGYAPRAVTGFDQVLIGPYSRFLPLFDSNVIVTGEQPCAHTIQENGTIRGPTRKCTFVPLTDERR